MISLSALLAFLPFAGKAKSETPKPDHQPLLDELRSQLEIAREFNRTLAEVGERAVVERDALRKTVAEQAREIEFLQDQRTRLRAERDLHMDALRAYYSGSTAAPSIPGAQQEAFIRAAQAQDRAQHALAAQLAVDAYIPVPPMPYSEMQAMMNSGLRQAAAWPFCSCTPPGRAAMFRPRQAQRVEPNGSGAIVERTADRIIVDDSQAR